MKKASLSLSTNAIVVLILAITMLGLALGFIKTMFGKTSAQVEAVVSSEAEPIPAGPGNPLTLSRTTLVLSPSDTTALKFSVYKGNVITTEPSLVGYWSFDEGSGNFANDLSGKGNKGTLGSTDANYPVWVDGKFGKALKFDGIDDFVVVTNPIDIQNYITIMTRMKTSEIADHEILVSKSLPYLSRNFNRVYFSVSIDGTQRAVQGITNIAINTWYHFAGTFDGNNMRVYLDGKLDNSAVYPGLITCCNTNLYNFGRHLNANTYAFHGSIDEVQIYNRALSADEIKNIAQGNLIAVNKGCIADSIPTPDKPLQIISQVSKNVPNGESETSSVVIKASNSPVDTVCEICATPLGGGGCVDVRVIVK